MAPLIDLQAARALIQAQTGRNDPVELALDAAVGRVLAEDLTLPIDSPPHDKAMVDGFAVQAADLPQGTGRLSLSEVILAGRMPRHSIRSGQTARIMTGGVLPHGADAVVMIEQTVGEGLEGDAIEIVADRVVAEQNVMRRGSVARAGQVVLPRGHGLRAVDVGILAEANRTAVQVIRPPHVAIVQTGDELVDVGQPVGPGQIRNSNGPVLRAMLRQAGGIVDDLGIVRDDVRLLHTAVERGLAADLLVLSGGVSMGDRDLVPGALAAAGVECVFHKVQLRPGKPAWFGVRRGTRPGEGAERTTLVFGLPGNPVSNLVCCRLFVIPTLRALAGFEPHWDGDPRPATLTQEFVLRGPRPSFWPAHWDATEQQVEPLEWHGSADPFALARANCWVHFPEGNRTYRVGELVPVLTLDG